jgi:assimilatory nitrate reductase electron transfer subunit
VTRVVVAGAGLAGHEVVRRLLADASFDGTITWHAGEAGHPYNRVLLTDLLAGRHAPSAIELPTLSDPRLTYRTTPLRSIAKTEFDHLVLATGAEPVIPPVRGNAVPLRTLGDVRTILNELDHKLRRVAVVGGGPLGVETACALASRGLRVELAHRGPHLLSRWLDAESAALLAGSLAEAGIHVHCDTEVSAASGVWPGADLVILACGVQPRVALARAAGLPISRGILVDGYGRSLGDERIFAIGDCAEKAAAERASGALAALDDAGRAAAAILGSSPLSGASPRPVTPPFQAAPTPLRLRTYDIPGADVAVLGRPGAEASIHFTDQRRRTRKVLALEGDVPVAAALVGDVAAAAALAHAIARPASPAPRVPAALLTSGAARGAGGFGDV